MEKLLEIIYRKLLDFYLPVSLTLEDLKKQEKFMMKLKYYPMSLFLIIPWFILLFVVCCHFYSELNICQNIIMIFLSIISVLNLCLCLTSEHLTEIKEYKPHIFWTSLLISLIAICIAIFATKWENSGNGRIMIWVCLVAFLGFTNVYMTECKRVGMVSMDNRLKQITFIEIIGTIIALLQLCIAFPSLKLQFDSATSQDIKELKEQQEKLYEYTQQFVMVDIPDSLQNEEVKKAKKFQMQLFSTAVGISSLPFVSIDINKTRDKKEAISIINVIKEENVRENLVSQYYIEAGLLVISIIKEYRDTIKHKEIGNRALKTMKVTYANRMVKFASDYLRDRKNFSELLDRVSKMQSDKDIIKGVEDIGERYNDLVGKKKQFQKMYNIMIFSMIKSLNYVQLYYAYDIKNINIKNYTIDFKVKNLPLVKSKQNLGKIPNLPQTN